jgi:hypothetical protein
VFCFPNHTCLVLGDQGQPALLLRSHSVYSESELRAVLTPVTSSSVEAGTVMEVNVTGSTSGGCVYGTSDVYHYQSSVATVAVHLCVVKAGQTTLKGFVSVLPAQQSYAGSTQFGVTSCATQQAAPASVGFLSSSSKTWSAAFADYKTTEALKQVEATQVKAHIAEHMSVTHTSHILG